MKFGQTWRDEGANCQDSEIKVNKIRSQTTTVTLYSYRGITQLPGSICVNFRQSFQKWQIGRRRLALAHGSRIAGNLKGSRGIKLEPLLV